MTKHTLNYLKNILILVAFGASVQGVAQTTSEATVTVVFKNNTPELLQVLFAEHGIEQTEIICLNLKSYELQHNVTVMADNRYASYRRDLLSAIHSADTQKEASLLEAKLNQIVSYTSVKEEVER